MKILSVGNFLNPSWDGSIPDEEHIAQALESLGHEVRRIQREDMQTTRWQYDDNGELYNSDFTLIAQWDGYDTRVLLTLPKPIVYWAFDYQADGQEWHELLIRLSDLYLSKRIADSRYKNWQWLSQDFAPQFLAEAKSSPLGQAKTIDVLFTGSYLPWATERIDTLKAIDSKFNLTIHSVTPDQWKDAGFKTVYGPIMDEQLPELIGKTKINISIDHTIEAGYWSDRNAQIMACGGFVLSRYVPLAEIAFGIRVVYFNNIEDCLAKIEQYLENDFERQHIATLGQAFAINNLMTKDRVTDLLTIVENIL